MARPGVADEIARRRERQQIRTQITADWVQEELRLLYAADPRELVEFHRYACRYCWGDGHRYQKTAAQRERQYREWAEKQTKRSAETFDEEGGVGFNGRRDPAPDCPECFGEGIGRVIIHDTRHLSAGAVRLYAGVRETKDGGLEVKLNDQQTALDRLAKHVGFYAADVEGALTIDERARVLKAALDAMSAPDAAAGR